MSGVTVVSGPVNECLQQAAQFCVVLLRSTNAGGRGSLFRADPTHWISNGSRLHLTVEEGQVVAGCSTRGRGIVWLEAFATDPDRSGAGFGQRALSKAIEDARTRGAKSISLIIRLTNGNPAEPAFTIYRRLGFCLLPGIYVYAIEWSEASRHIFPTADPDGSVFRCRKMELLLRPGGING